MKLKLTPDPWDKHWSIKRGNPGKDLWGSAKWPDNAITVSPSVSTPEHTAAVVGHEVVHVWLRSSGLSGFLKHDQEEALCDVIGRRLGDLVLSHTGDTLKDAFLCRPKKK